MKILLPNPHGFCAGVVMAIQSLEKALELYGAPIYVFHEIVHNKHVVEGFCQRGVIFVDGLDEIPESSHVLFSAHGVSPDIRKQARARRLKTIDATCPLVSKVHTEAVKFVAAGYSVLLIGHAGHDEAVGTIGEAPEQIQLIETIEDVDTVKVPDPNKVAYLTQTTLSPDHVKNIVDRLEHRYPQIIGPAKQDICFATQNRQTAVKELLSEADVVLVIGSQNSSNSNRLAEVAREAGKPSYLIDHVGEIDPNWLRQEDTVILTAGASAPEVLVDECLAYLCSQFQATVESRDIRQERARFDLPVELRSVL